MGRTAPPGLAAAVTNAGAIVMQTVATPEEARRAVDLGADIIVAQGVWLGTRFLATVESGAHDDFKKRLLEARATDTVFTMLFDQGWPDAAHRALRNSTVRMWEEAGCPATGKRPREGRSSALFPMEIPSGATGCRPRCRALLGKSKHSRSMPVSLWG